jgi:hypothetical protein
MASSSAVNDSSFRLHGQWSDYVCYFDMCQLLYQYDQSIQLTDYVRAISVKRMIHQYEHVQQRVITMKQ